MKLLVFKFSTFSCYLLLLMPIYLPQYTKSNIRCPFDRFKYDRPNLHPRNVKEKIMFLGILIFIQIASKLDGKGFSTRS